MTMTAISDKQEAYEALRQMSEHVSWQQICEEFAIHAALREGIADADAGNLIPHEEAMERAKAWTTR